MNWRVRPKIILLTILIAVFIFSLSYFSYLQRHNQQIHRLNTEMEKTYRLVYEMTREKEKEKEIDSLIEENGWTFHKTKHFDIYCQNKVIAGRLRDSIEEIYKNITEGLGYSSVELEYKMDKKIRIFIFNDLEDYREKTESPFPWSIGNAVYSTNSFYSYEGEHLKGLIPHELAHLLFYRFLKGSYDLGAMRWLSEGVAMYGEFTVYAKFFNEVLSPKINSVRKGEYISIRDLIKATDLHKENIDRVHLWYVECFSLVNFMIEQEGKEKFKEFCIVLSKERRIKSALSIVYPEEFSSIEELEEKWLRYLKTHKIKV